MVSDQEIANGVELLLRQSDPSVLTSVNVVVQQLEAKLGLDLSHKAGFIQDQIDHLLRPHTRPPPPNHHYSIHRYPQFQNSHPQIPPHFVLHHHRHGELNFRSPQPQSHPQTHLQSLPQHQPQPQPQPHPSQQSVNASVSDVGATAPENPKESAPTVAKRRGGPGGLNKACGISPELQAIVGEPTMPRTQVVKQLWAYIRKNNLQDPSNKRKIICDDALRLVFETDCTDMFKMNKLLAKHISSLEPKKESSRDSKRLKVDVESATESSEMSPSPVVISDALAQFFGTGVREMLQSEALRRIWEYIKVHHLEDPLNAMVIICDAKLQDLFRCESISVLGVPEILARHFFKRS